MELSAQKTKEAKKHNVTVEQLVMADLMSIGYSETDAYAVAFPHDAILNVEAQQKNRKEITSKTAFVELCEQRRDHNSQRLEFLSDLSNIELIDTETAAKEILKVAKNMPEGSKERGEMFMKYADLTRKNEATTQDITDCMNFYFPVKCNQCPLLKAYNDFIKKRDNKEQEITPVEMNAIIRRSETAMEKARKKAGD